MTLQEDLKVADFENQPIREAVNLPVMRYRDSDGNPTCIADARNGSYCPFLTTSGFGTREHCFWLEGSVKSRPQLERRNRGYGTTIPHKECPLWLPVELTPDAKPHRQ